MPSPCPCGGAADYDLCCRRYLDGRLAPPDAEALMARLNRALEQLLARGELDILKSYNPRSLPAPKSQ